MLEWSIIAVSAYLFGYWWRGSDVLALLAEKKAIRAETRRLRAMYEAAKGDLDDVLRSRDEVTDLLEEAQG